MVMNSAVRCDVEWLYKKNGIDVAVDVGQAISVYCAIKFSELCTHSAPFLIKDCSGCSPPTPIGNDTFKCDGNKWRMSDGSVEVTEVKCKRKGNERTSAWQTDNGIAITEGACSQDFDCATFNNFNFPVPKKDEVHVYKAVDKIGDGNRLNCSEGFNLTYISSDGATKIIDEDLICDTGMGFFYPEGHSKEKEKQANHTSSVYCAKKYGEVIKKDNPENAQLATGAMSSTTIAASIGGTFVVLLIVGGIVGFILFRRSKRIEEEKALEERKRNTLSTCREIDVYKEVLRQDGNKWVIDEIPEKERLIRDKIRNKLIEFDPLDYHVIGDQKAADNDPAPRPGEFDYWTNIEYIYFIFYKFHRYTVDQRIICLRAVTAFISYSEADDWKGKTKKHFGTINQFFDILKMSHTHKLKDVEVWEHLYRMCIRFYASCTDSHAVNPQRRFRDLWKEIVKSMLDDLGSKAVPKENYHMTGIRRIALRIMLWLKDKKWTMFIAEEAKKPLSSIAAEIRPVVLQYAVREGGREEEIKMEFYDEVKREEWEPWEGVKHGIYRHHLIYALCSAKDIPDEEGRKNLYTTRREIIDAIFKNPKDLNRIFTPKDIFWAFKGATEEPEAAVYSVDMFSTNMCSYSCKDIEAWIDVIIRRTEGLENRRDRMLVRLQDAWRGCVEFAVPEGANKDFFNEEMIEQRVHNVRLLCDNPKLNKLIVTGMEQSGFRAAPVDGGA
ncbi:hypothetical protein PRIPAC_70086 [Pristionchus pacificus]|uniref:Uncharacterized protein n=1 Tax=Pristionchus pacificus TaxID=54126 RepID=A0A2A6BRB0_PRIPA|nr:hypothetical protein PRIPAC_70086 [Pristionchus pacificus]|eukprot:PDM68492.1 hypothetical protein PRIPAC_43994 [Pristionchus pacificus]